MKPLTLLKIFLVTSIILLGVSLKPVPADEYLGGLTVDQLGDRLWELVVEHRPNYYDYDRVTVLVKKDDPRSFDDIYTIPLLPRDDDMYRYRDHAIQRHLTRLEIDRGERQEQQLVLLQDQRKKKRQIQTHQYIDQKISESQEAFDLRAEVIDAPSKRVVKKEKVRNKKFKSFFIEAEAVASELKDEMLVADKETKIALSSIEASQNQREIEEQGMLNKGKDKLSRSEKNDMEQTSLFEDDESSKDKIKKTKLISDKPKGEPLLSKLKETAAKVSQKAGEVKDKIVGQTPEEAKLPEPEYWEVDVNDQSIEQIKAHQNIDKAFTEAKKLGASEPKMIIRKKNKKIILTPQEVVRSAINEDNRAKRIDLDFDETNLADILLIMSDAGDVNIALDPSLKNNTLDLHLKQVSVEEALLLIANSYDLGFKLIGESIFITEKEKIRNESTVSTVIKLKNVSVEEAEDLFKDIVDTVAVSPEINSLIVIGDPEQISQVEAIARAIDVPQPQVLLEAKIIEVNKDALREIGVDWSDQITLQYQESSRPQDFDDNENATRSVYKLARFERNAFQFETTLRMLESQNKAKVLSAPRVTTLNDKQAEIFVGDEVPYTITNITGGVVTNDVRFVEPGIRLTITPSIIEDEFVVMKVQPEVSFIVAFRGPNDEFPQVRTREATSFVRVKDGEAFILGGILNQEDREELFKVPFLGNVPVLKSIFSYQRNTVIDTELIITVVPTIIRSDV